jgi:O-antigen/teichoic acid export membrane protein
MTSLAHPNSPDEVPIEQEDLGFEAPRPEGDAPPMPSLKRQTFSGTLWTFGSVGMGNVVRLAANLIMTRLLVPEAFGMMVMVNVVMQGLLMFSDVGIGPVVIQHKRGGEASFLNTAWTIQVIRGFVLFMAACALAYPLALYRHEPLLLQLLPVTALTAVMDGCSSTAPGEWHRKMRIGSLTVLELSRQVVNVVAMIAFALVHPSVWALVFGGLVASFINLIVTHTLIRQTKNKFCWDKDAVRDLIRFGRWIFIATAFTFLAGQGDRLILGGFLTNKTLGLYGIAFWLATSPVDIVKKITTKVLFPVYARLADDSIERLHRQIRRVRGTVMLAMMPSLCLCVVFGSDIIEILYDPRYHHAGWMMQVLAIGGIFQVITLTSAPVLLAMGDSFRHMMPVISRCVMLLVCMIIGYQVGIRHGGPGAGEAGLVMGIAATSAVNYPVFAIAINKYKAWMPKLDLLAFLGCAAYIGVAYLLKSLLY